VKFDGLIRIGFAALTALFQKLAKGALRVADGFIYLAGWAHRRSLPDNLT
jgi:hypothetical protein